jgi:hypothetical protein
METEEYIDEKVLSYIKRAWEIEKDDLFAKNNFSINITIDIAKMIQNEEFVNRGLYK